MQRRSLLRWTAGARRARGADAPVGRAAARREQASRRADLRSTASIWTSFPPELARRARGTGLGRGQEPRPCNGAMPTATRRCCARMPKSWSRSAPDAIVARGTPATHALQRATTIDPDPHRGRRSDRRRVCARRYAAPGGNITGISWAIVETSAEAGRDPSRAGAEARLAAWCVASAPIGAPFVAEMTRLDRGGDANAAGIAMRDRARRQRESSCCKPRAERLAAADDVGALIFGLGQRRPEGRRRRRAEGQ